MATKDRRKLQHIHSSIADKQPTPQSLEVGEIAVNNSANKEFLSLKNSNDKVVRFSSDSTIIDWIENKEVMPYSGVVDNVHLDTNRSNIEIKINQVAAKNTPKYNLINGAVDIDGQPVNPSTDGGKTDGAGIAIDMSRYAMIGANPTFSSITVTHRSNLSGTTNISNGAGGTALNITTTDVTANDANWTEAITNKKSTVTTEEDKITTLNESATTRTTVVGTESLTVNGTTTEVHTGDVTITNSANVTATTNGTTTETKKNVVTENNLSAKTENTTGVLTENNSSNHIVNTTGTTTIKSTGSTNIETNGTNNKVTIQASGTGGDVEVFAKDTLCESGVTAAFNGTTKTNIGLNCNDTTSATTTNIYGTTINHRANSADTRVTSAYTSATTATTVIGTANTSATTATLSGNTLDITEATRLSAKTPSTYVSGTSLNVVETNTDIESCRRISGKTNEFTIQECATGSGKTVINQTDIKASGKTLSFDETTSISAKTPTTTLSGTGLTITETTSTINSTNTNLTGTNLTISESNTSISSCTKLDIVSDDLNFGSCTTAGTIDFNFCNGFGVNSNNIKLHQCASAGTISISAQTQNINGGNLTVNESGNTAINTTGTTNIKSTGNTNVETNGANNKVTIQASGTGGDVEVFAKDTLCMSGGTTAAMVGTTKTNIGKNCSDGGQTTTLNLNGTTINETGTTVNISGSSSANISGATVNVSGGSICETASATAAFVGATTTNIGSNCSGGGNTAALNVRGAATNISAGTLTETVTGTTNETHTGAVTINNGSAKTETTTGAVTENNKAGYTVNTTGDTCLQSTADVNVGGAANTNIGTNCDDSVKANYVNIKAKSGITETANTVTISGTTSANISGATVNVSGGSINETSSGKTCITAGSDLNIGGDANTNIGYNCAGTGIANNTNIFASTAVTINAPKTNITGDTYLSGKTYFNNTCEAVEASELSDAFCEVVSRGAITIEKNTSPTDPQLATIYTVKQNGTVINTIEVAKDQFLQNAEVVKNTSGEWVIRLTWWIYDPDSGTHTTATTDVNASELVKDLTAVNPGDNGTATNHNVKVSSWYDSESGDMKFSAETTPTMHVTNLYATTNVSASTVSGTSTSAGTLTVTSNTTLKATTATSISASTEVKSPSISGTAVSADTFYGKMSKKLTWSGGTFSADTEGYNGSADKTITVPTAISHLATRGKLTITHNGLTDTYDPATDKPMTLPHSALSFSYGSVSAKTGSDSYNTSAAKSITIPTSIDDLKNYNGTCVEIPHNVCVTGTITSSGAIYSSDRNLKENIMNVTIEEINKASNVLAKSFNFKSDESKSKVYGVIAQEVQEAGLDELVHTDGNGNLGVDYTSLLLLKIAYLEDLCGKMYGKILKLEDKLNDK